MKSETRYIQNLLKLVSINTGSLLLYFLVAGWLEHKFALHGIAFFGAMILTLITCFYVLFKIAYKNDEESEK